MDFYNLIARDRGVPADHGCEYQSTVGGNADFKCNCCAMCTDRCQQAI